MSTCAKCGQEHVTRRGGQACTGHISSGPRQGQPCANDPLVGLEVCRYHGGAAPQARAAGRRRELEAQATRAVVTLGLPIDISPTEALLDEVRWTAGHVAWLRQRVQELDERALVWGVTQAGEKHSTEKGTETSTTHSAAPSIWYQLYAKERDRLVTVSAAALKAGVEERKVRLAEQQGEIVIALIRRVLDGLYAALLAAGLTEHQLGEAWAQAVADVVPREIRATEGISA